MPVRDEELPSTLRNSPVKARRTYLETLDAAHDEYPGDEERAHRTAWAAVKHSFEKVGDQWVPKKRKGPSDPGAKRRGPRPSRDTAGGVDVEGHTKQELLERARKLDVKGASHMNKLELGQAIARKQRSR